MSTTPNGTTPTNNKAASGDQTSGQSPTALPAQDATVTQDATAAQSGKAAQASHRTAADATTGAVAAAGSVAGSATTAGAAAGTTPAAGSTAATGTTAEIAAGAPRPQADVLAKATTKLLQSISKEAVITDKAALYPVSMDSARLSFLPDALVRPANGDTNAVATVLELANRYRIPVTTRGAGTATTGAASPVHGGWVLDLSLWNDIEIDATAGMAHVGAGAVTAKVNAAAEARGWFFPPDPSSLKHCTIGGNIATNAGGLRGAKYGVTRDYVFAVEAFLPTGERTRWGAPLKKYASGFNVRDLLIGSEGQLAVITAATLKLLPKPEQRWTALAAFADEDAALLAVEDLLASALVPSILEFLDRQSVECTERRRGAAFFESLPGLPVGHSPALLLLEIDGSQAQLAEQKAQVLAWLGRHALAHRESADAVQAEALWEARRTCSQSMFQMGDTKLNEDIVVPVRSYRALLAYTLELRAQTGLATPTFGHVADGNFHVHLMFNHADPQQAAQAERGVHLLMEKVIELGGAITGEHGIGLAKSPFLPLQHSQAEMDAMLRIKQALDPQGILNPGKVFVPFEMWKHPRAYDHVFPWDHKRH